MYHQALSISRQPNPYPHFDLDPPPLKVIVKFDPADVVTAAQAAQTLAALIKPLPSFG